MLNGRVMVVCLGMAWAALAGAASARADDLPVPRPPPPPTTARAAVPLGAPPARGQVPVPDVRGMSEGQATRALAEAGLRMGGVERVSIARLQQSLGRRYAPGIVVQQAPAPSASGRPRWLARGSPVWLRVSTGTATRATAPRAQPAPPTAPRTAVPPGRTTYPGPAAPAGSSMPRPPPPPYAVDGARPAPAATPYDPRPATPGLPSMSPSGLSQAPDGSASRRPGGFAPACATCPEAAGIVANIRTAISLPCERRRSRWHVRAAGGWAFSAGTDSGDSDFLAGVDIGRTFAGCIGVDLYYRYTAQTFDVLVPGGLLEDAGGFHHFGLIASYQATFNRTSRLYWFVGLGLGWYEAEGYETGGGGFEGYFQGGLGYMLSNKMRLRFGLDAFADDTKSGRFDPARDGSSRLLWIFSPTISLEFDF